VTISVSCGRSHYLTAWELQRCEHGRGIAAIVEPYNDAQHDELISKAGLFLDQHGDEKEAEEDGRFTHVHTGMFWPHDSLYECPPEVASWNQMVRGDPVAREVEKIMRAQRGVKRISSTDLRAISSMTLNV